MRRKKKLDSENAFTCPTCGSDSMDYLGLSPTGSSTFKCRKCKKVFFKSRPIVAKPSYKITRSLPNREDDVGYIDISSPPEIDITRITCPNCNSHRIVDAGYSNRFRCKECGKVFT